MAVKKMQSARSLDPRPETERAARGVDDLLALTDDDVSALMPPAPQSSPVVRAREGAPSRGARPSPKASGKFVTDRGRLVGPKIVKRADKRELGPPKTTSGAYAKAVAPPARAASPVAPPKLEDFADLVSELESLVELPQDEERTVVISTEPVPRRPAEARSVMGTEVDLHATISEAVQAALPQMPTVPLSVATLVEASASAHAAVAEVKPETAPPAARIPAIAEIARETPAPAPPAERAPARPARRRRTVITVLTAVALLGAAGAMAWHHGLVPRAIASATSPAAPAVAVLPPTVVATEPAPPPQPAEAAEGNAAAGADAHAASTELAEPTEAKASAGADAHTASTAPAGPTEAKPPAGARAHAASGATERKTVQRAAPSAVAPTPEPAPKSAAPATKSGEETAAAAEPSKDDRRVAAKPARRTRATKGSDDGKTGSGPRDEVDEETKKALEALQKSQLESSF